ncbi:hypothetical protein PF005_g2156 [Phytophthora fragariae]|uniref:Uncharacterized protein n=1 Tax=Phytophthora fragariae TaxID=53985 RepID=A0A6A3FVN5_9STRA|nr:hypothetical protein PF003_g27968 [Phytophthora fragariae]KAE8949322.1 hypothetical protein PF009_g1134 [Phytophthora fragariae]KAE9028607.1 hypothetical protein PF011_g1481 [Phytophthora fragariae]KAE9138470.1 hypothetical protein PF010_g955 [Phytophthora fragariae]KAE9139562.1 hypothetical protein PF007_g983 [Phytophthora fragariae]
MLMIGLLLVALPSSLARPCDKGVHADVRVDGALGATSANTTPLPIQMMLERMTYSLGPDNIRLSWDCTSSK